MDDPDDDNSLFSGRLLRKTKVMNVARQPWIVVVPREGSYLVDVTYF